MPSKRDPGKQRRQAQNRAAREARLARREAANRSPERRSASASSAASTSAADRKAAARAARRQRRAQGGAFAGKPPGYRAAFLALLFSVGSIASVALSNPEVDEDGRAYSFTELAEREDQRDAGADLPEERRNGLAAAWPLSALLVLPIGAGAVAVLAGQRAADPTKAWMRCMFATVVFALIAANIPPGYTILYLPMVVALGVATFQSRRAQLTARAAASGAAGAEDEPAGAGDVIETTAEDAQPESSVDVGDGDGDGDGDAGDEGDGPERTP